MTRQGWMPRTSIAARSRLGRGAATFTGLSRELSFDFLDRAGGSVKIAVVMHAARLTQTAAAERLASAGNNLGRALGQPAT